MKKLVLTISMVIAMTSVSACNNTPDTTGCEEYYFNYHQATDIMWADGQYTIEYTFDGETWEEIPMSEEVGDAFDQDLDAWECGKLIVDGELIDDFDDFCAYLDTKYYLEKCGNTVELKK